jgi:hypothetical protein
MKKTITQFAIVLTTTLCFLSSKAQTYTADFESFTLTPSSYYKDTNSVPFQTSNALFRHKWTNGGFPYWSGGFAYTNIHDSVQGSYKHLYSCKPKFGYNNSNTYVTGKNGGVIVVKGPYDQVDGFYITNTTYADSSIRYGDGFGKKFGGATGNDPDWFKITVKGYLNGSMKTDSSEFYLADFRFTNNTQDYVIQTWQWLNTSNLGQVDSIKFFMYSSDVGSFGINTPLFFSIDNIQTVDNVVGISENKLSSNLSAYPNPFKDKIIIQLNSENEFTLNITDVIGKQVYSQSVSDKTEIDLSLLPKGVYFAEIRNEHHRAIKKIVKE